MGKVGASLQLPYPAETVYRVATRIEDLPRWLPEVVDAALLDPTLTVGSRVRLRMGAGAGNVEVTGTVRQLRPPSIVVIGGSAGPLSIEVRTRLDANQPGATRVVLEIEIGSPPLLGFIAREAERRINAELQGALQRFRALVEAEAA
ncbi:MAG TPA: SRPBCC family protein [Candidatus Limnocylindrales bacterium]|nr:SRPBCC family protein [Candidatus Limnocylindrales bacterium]